MNKIWTIYVTVDIDTGEIITKWIKTKKEYKKISETIKYTKNEYGQTIKQITRKVRHNGQTKLFDN